MSLKKTSLFLVGLLIALVALVAAGCGGGGGSKAPEALPSSSCTAIEYGGDGNPDYLVVSDLPLQGASRTQTLQINDAVRYELKQAGYKGVLSVECGTEEQAVRSLSHLNKVLAELN